MKKQLNYKSLNTLGDVDITQSVVPGGGEAEVKEDVRYYKASGMVAQEFGFISSLCRFIADNNVVVAGAGVMLMDDITIEAIAIDYNAEIIVQGKILTISEYITSMGVGDLSSVVPEITKEEFYKLPIALTIYGPTEDDAIDYEDKMKTTFDTLWAIWERDGIDGQDLNITIPNADIASVTLIGNEGTHVLDINSMLGNIDTTTSEIIHSIRFNGQYGATLSKTENLTTGEITYEYIFMS